MPVNKKISELTVLANTGDPVLIETVRNGANFKLLCNLQASAAPLVTNDSSQGYSVGSIWNFAGVLYTATSVSVGSAVWVRVNSESGIYTPEASGLVNLDDCTPRPSYYTRVGNIVTVQGRVSYTPTAAGALDFTLTLPFTSTSSEAFLMQITTDLDGSFINAASSSSTIPIGFTSLGLGTDLVFTMSYSIV